MVSAAVLTVFEQLLREHPGTIAPFCQAIFLLVEDSLEVPGDSVVR